MDKEELLSQFTAKVDEFSRFQEFIDKARAQADKFKASVVEKVIQTNTDKAMGVVEDLIPLTSEVDGVLEALASEKQDIQQSQQSSREELEELELRLAIGEFTDKEFNKLAGGLKKALDESDAQVANIDVDLERFGGVLASWRVVGEAAGVLSAVPDLDDVEPDMEGFEDLEGEDDLDAEAFSDASSEGVHVERVTVRDDMSDVFGGTDGPMVDVAEEILEADADELLEADADDLIEADAEELLEADAEELIEAADDLLDAGDDLLASSDDLLDGGDDILEAGDDLDLLGEAAGGASGDEDATRRAVLLYQEGTAEEQVYPISGELMSLGRGRDNDIQVKNDSKVSRYHCKIYRRGPNFYVEDNKSANGSLVNGELITERRLFGGEEIIIGETFFRFRILD